jgi:hypothetical protein
VLRRRTKRFPGAGGSTEREFKRQLHKNIRDEWKVWLIVPVVIVGLAVWSFYVGRVPGRILAAASGFSTGVLFVVYSLGGHISAFRWWLGAEGERETASEIERLSGDWHCEHDLEHEWGNYDHVLIGPPGVFLLDTKLLHGTAVATNDALRCGRLSFAGSALRGGARRVKDALEQQLGFRAPWVQPVIVIWGDFPQGLHEEQGVVYITGGELVPWLQTLPEKATMPQRAAFIAALRQVREELRHTKTASSAQLMRSAV